MDIHYGSQAAHYNKQINKQKQIYKLIKGKGQDGIELGLDTSIRTCAGSIQIQKIQKSINGQIYVYTA